MYISITLFRVTTGWCWYFYPIFTLTFTVLACFIRKINKLFRDFAPTLSPGHYSGPLGPPRTPAAIIFGFAKNQCTHIFSVLSPDKCISLFTKHIMLKSLLKYVWKGFEIVLRHYVTFKILNFMQMNSPGNFHPTSDVMSDL